MSSATSQEMSEVEREVLNDLRALCDRYPDVKARPMDVGGWNGSHHSGTLARLQQKGLVENVGYRSHVRRVNKYRITKAGREVLE